jgi:hypothetical protein
MGLGASGIHDGGPNVSEGIATGGGIINDYAGGVIYRDGRAIQVDDSSNGDAYSATDGDETFTFSKIKDFAVGEEQMLLDSKVFKALAAGALAEDAFAIGKTANSAHVRILIKNGNICYDADGKGGEHAVLFAKVGKHVDLSADDFFVV